MAELLLPAESTAEFRAGNSSGVICAHPVHGLKHGAEAVLGSRWRLQTAQPACILPASCRMPCVLLGQSQAAASCWGGLLAAPSRCWWVRMLRVLVEKAEFFF